MNILKILCIILILFIASVFAINIPDEELTEGAKQLISEAVTPPVSAEQEEENAYFALLGFEAPEQEDIVEAGRRVYATYYRARQEGRFEPENVLTDIVGPPPLFTPSENIPTCALREDTPCLPLYEQHSEEIERLYHKNKLILDRYRSLTRFSFFRDLDPIRRDSWSPWSRYDSAFFAASRLNIGEAARRFNKGEQQKGVELVLADIALWRKLMPGFSDIDGKYSAQRNLSRDYLLLAEMVAQSPEIAAPLLNHAVLSPLSEQERSLDFVWDTYFQTMSRLLANELSFLERRFFKVNATLNDAYEVFGDLKKVSAAQSTALDAELSELDGKIERFGQVRINLVYNPLGKMFIAAAFDTSVAADWNHGVEVLDGLITALRDQAGKVAGS